MLSRLDQQHREFGGEIHAAEGISVARTAPRPGLSATPQPATFGRDPERRGRLEGVGEGPRGGPVTRFARTLERPDGPRHELRLAALPGTLRGRQGPQYMATSPRSYRRTPGSREVRAPCWRRSSPASIQARSPPRSGALRVRTALEHEVVGEQLPAVGSQRVHPEADLPTPSARSPSPERVARVKRIHWVLAATEPSGPARRWRRPMAARSPGRGPITNAEARQAAPARRSGILTDGPPCASAREPAGPRTSPGGAPRRCAPSRRRRAWKARAPPRPRRAHGRARPRCARTAAHRR